MPNVLFEATTSAGGMSSLVESLGNGLSTVANDMVSAIGAIVPYALPVMGAVAVIGIGIGIFRKVAHR